MGVVFIDRADKEKAIEALGPAVETLRNGTSLVIAPEGTRSETERLGPFKKGAFHMAMQAGVPIVPVVIHNALDSQPKGEVLFRPAMVQVEVLPAVDTSRWKTADIDRHVAEVRGMFLDALGQTEAKPRKKKAATRKKAAARKKAGKRKSPARSKRK